LTFCELTLCPVLYSLSLFSAHSHLNTCSRLDINYTG
jgi:hypothetical protein